MVKKKKNVNTEIMDKTSGWFSRFKVDLEIGTGMSRFDLVRA